MEILKKLGVLYLILAMAVSCMNLVGWLMHTFDVSLGLGVGTCLGLMSAALLGLAMILKKLGLNVGLPFIFKI